MREKYIKWPSGVTQTVTDVCLESYVSEFVSLWYTQIDRHVHRCAHTHTLSIYISIYETNISETNSFGASSMGSMALQ